MGKEMIIGVKGVSYIHAIITTAENPNTTTDDLAEVVAKDKDVTDRLMRLAKSAYLKRRTDVENVKQAIMVVGFDKVISIALGD